MTKQVKLTSIFLLITAIVYAQKPQSIVNTTKSNIKDKVVVDTIKKMGVLTTENMEKDPKYAKCPNCGRYYTVDAGGSTHNTKTCGVKDLKLSAADSLKRTQMDTEQARSEQVNPPINGVGVVVKKNPGGGASRVGTTNDKGEIELTIKEKGDYTLLLSTGVAGVPTNNTAAKSTGGPVKGVKVALGGNGCCVQQSPCCGKEKVSAITNDIGEVSFQNLEPGSYLLMVHAATGGTSTKMGTQN